MSHSPFITMMTQEGLPEAVIRQFCGFYDQWKSGQTGKIRWESFGRLSSASLPQFRHLAHQDAERGVNALAKLAVLRLNGGLGTTMGCQGAKSCLKVAGDRTFLDVIMENIKWVHQTYDVKVPIYFMNSFNTQAETLSALSDYKDVHWETFLQHKFPRIQAVTGTPFSHPSNKALEWNPPGHGDVYQALQTQSILDRLIEQGIDTLFIANSDNLGAVPDPKILGWMIEHKHDFVMEVAERGPLDRKGGCPVLMTDGKMALLEVAQVPDNHLEDFQDSSQFNLFNTNNLWIHLPTLQTLLSQKQLHLSLIVNPKSVDGTPVVQLETAMGSAIQSFSRAAALLVPRDRFFPVKTTEQLFVLRSDAVLIQNGQVTLHPDRRQKTLPKIHFSKEFQTVDGLDQRIPDMPTMTQLDSLSLEGDITLGKNVVLTGNVSIRPQLGETLHIEDGTTW